MVTKFIWVSFRKKGLHCYPNASMDIKLKSVSYLANEHRHLFWFKVAVEVFDLDREIEFHKLLNWLESLYSDEVLVLNFKSCEMICSELIDALSKKFPNRRLQVDVSEDGECGSILMTG